jgi:hypothetical protein
MFVARQILNSGYLPLDDIYPIMHIWLSVLYNFLSDFIILTVVLSITFFILYILSLYILGKTILGTKTGGLFLSVFGIPLIFSFLHYGYIPFFFAQLTFPLILYVYQKILHDPSRKNMFYICMVFLSIFIVFCHPMISVFLVIIFSIFAVYEFFKRWGTSRQSSIEAAYIVIILSLTLILWWLQFRDLLGTLQRILFALLGYGSYSSIINSQMGAILTSNVSIWLVIDLFLKVYGPICLYFSFASFFLLYILYQYYRNRKIYENDFIYSLQFYVALFIGILLITGFFAIDEPIRAAMLGLIFASIICGLFFYRIWSFTLSKKRQLGLSISITLVMTLVCMVTILALYYSPWVGLPNPELTYEEKNGIDWILTYRNTEIPLVSETGQMWKYSSYYYESTNISDNQDFIQYPWRIPTHFGYMTNRTLGDSFAYLPYDNVYLITTESMKMAPYAVSAERRTRLKSFTDPDFIRLKNDFSVNQVYSSNEFGAWDIAIP